MEITVVGGFGVGKTIQVSRAPDAGETVSGGKYSEGPGGKGSNQAVQMARLGAKVSLISSVGDDDLATMGWDLWASEGIDSQGVVTQPEPTMVGFIVVDSAGENRIVLAPGALETMTATDLEPLYPVLDRSEMVVVSFELNPDVGLSALRHAREAGIKTVCNPAPAFAIPSENMSDIDVLIPNYGEALVLAGQSPASIQEPEMLSQTLRDLGAKSVVITLGEKGAFVDDGDRQELIPAVPVEKIVDTTGAGDSFVGALAVALSKGDDLFEATRFATHVAARTVAAAEVIPALPYAADVATTKETL